MHQVLLLLFLRCFQSVEAKLLGRSVGSDERQGESFWQEKVSSRRVGPANSQTTTKRKKKKLLQLLHYSIVI